MTSTAASRTARVSKLKGREVAKDSAASAMGAEAQRLRSTRKRPRADHADSDDNSDADAQRAAVAPASDSDSETSEDEDVAAVLPRPPKPQSRASAPSPSFPVVPRVSVPVSGASRSPRRSTVTIALPGSIIANAQSAELRTYVAGQIARAAAVFCVDRVVVFRDSPAEVREADGVEGEWRGAVRGSDPTVFLARLLQYLECPQYLRKFLFPVHADLRYAGLLNPLDAPHHLRATEYSAWREGVVVKRPSSGSTTGSSWVNVGLAQDVQVDRALPPLTRVTVRMAQDHTRPAQSGRMSGAVVSPERPRDAGLYWGFDVDVAPSFSAVFRSCRWTDDGAYDLTIGTSERGRVVQREDAKGRGGFALPRYRHLLVAFGGLNGLEECCTSDEAIRTQRVEDLFHLYLNTCAAQGSRTIRTEEAILITMSLLRSHVLANDAHIRAS